MIHYKRKEKRRREQIPRVREGGCDQEDQRKVCLRWAVTTEQQSQEQVSGDGRWVVCRAGFLKKKNQGTWEEMKVGIVPEKHKLEVLIPTSHIAMWPARTALHRKCQQRTEHSPRAFSCLIFISLC